MCRTCSISQLVGASQVNDCCEECVCPKWLAESNGGRSSRADDEFAASRGQPLQQGFRLLMLGEFAFGLRNGKQPQNIQRIAPERWQDDERRFGQLRGEQYGAHRLAVTRWRGSVARHGVTFTEPGELL